MSTTQAEGEAAAELIATMRRDHTQMKEFYNTLAAAAGDTAASTTTGNHVKIQEIVQELKVIQQIHGPKYPDLWKEVLNWKGWSDTRKLYLKYLDAKLSSNADNNNGQQQPTARKRRSRWATVKNQEEEEGVSASAPPTTTTAAAAAAASDANKRSRWDKAAPSASTGIMGLLPGMPANLSAQTMNQLSSFQNRLKVLNSKLQTVDADAARVDALPKGHRDRSPSPPPQYDSFGKRTNTRSIRWKQRFETERQDILEKIMDLNPQLHQNSGSNFVKRKRYNKVPIPVDQHPTYNFIGLIIGPRGKTQKELETKTNCKIAIRGKGSVKEGARGRGKGTYDSLDEPLHVLIMGERQEDVDKATEIIKQMLIVVDDDQNEFKQNQLRELALLNGTLKGVDEYCTICGEKGHRHFECPKRFSMNKSTAQVKCAICGDASHPTRDCPLRKKTEVAKDETHLDSEYMNFMAELNGGAAGNAGASSNGVVGNTSAPSSSQAGGNNSVGKPLEAVTYNLLNVGGINNTQTPTASAATTTPQSNGLPLPPPPPGLPPPAGLPPPPVSLPLPLPGSYPPQQSTASNFPSYDTISSTQPGQLSQHQPQQYYQPPPQQQHGQVKKRKGGEEDDELAGWDYRSYYSGTGGANHGAGGFNWWDQQPQG